MTKNLQEVIFGGGHGSRTPLSFNEGPFTEELASKTMRDRARDVAEELNAAPNGTARVAEDIERRFEEGRLLG